MSEIESWVWAPASPSEVHPASKLQCHFTCGFDLRHSLRLPFAAISSVLKGLVDQPSIKGLYHRCLPSS